MLWAATECRARVAVVEDDECVRDALAICLGAHHYRVTTYRSAEEALATGFLHGFSALISDLGLPGESGLSLLHRARRSSSTQVMVLITGTDQSELPAFARQDVDVVFRKPLSAEDLCTALARLLPRSAGAAEGGTNLQ